LGFARFGWSEWHSDLHLLAAQLELMYRENCSELLPRSSQVTPMTPLLTVDDYAAIPTAFGDFRIAYGDLPDQFGELFLPADPPISANGLYPTIILLHGGCWRDRFGLGQLGQMARRLNQADIAVWSLEYRRINAEIDQPDDVRGGWPMTFLDVAAGADHLRNLASEHSLDLYRVAAVGHSAGGHLAMWLGGRHKLPNESELHKTNPLSLCGVISLAGIPDLAVAQAEQICSGAPAELMGGTPEDFADRYAQGSPQALLPLGVRHCHLVGREDEVVPADYLRRFVAQAQELGDQAQLHVLPYAAHFEVIDAASETWASVEQQIALVLKTT
jgi:pimeloyl-ACP methyl ester carboxylesterase